LTVPVTLASAVDVSTEGVPPPLQPHAATERAVAAADVNHLRETRMVTSNDPERARDGTPTACSSPPPGGPRSPPKRGHGEGAGRGGGRGGGARAGGGGPAGSRVSEGRSATGEGRLGAAEVNAPAGAVQHQWARRRTRRRRRSPGVPAASRPRSCGSTGPGRAA